MNRLKLWVYMAALLGAGIGNVAFLSRWLTDRAIAQIDRELNRASAQVDARSQLLAGEAAQLADAVSRDPAVVQALSFEGGGNAATAARAAAQTLRVAGTDPSRPLLVVTATRGGRTFSVNGEPIQTDARIADVLSGATADAARREAHVVVGDALYYLVAVPVGNDSKVAVGVPVNAAWLAVLRATTGCDVTLLLEDHAPRGTLPAREASLVASAARGVPGPVDAGALPSQPATFGAAFPALPLLFAKAPAYRVRAIALKGLPGGALALSEPTSPLLAPVISYGWLSLVAIAAFLLLGLATGLLVTNEQKTMVPKDLVAAADRITRGDFSARAPVMAGSLGTIATALNRAAEAAEGARATAPPAAETARSAGEAAEAAAAQMGSVQSGTLPDFFGTVTGEPPSTFDAFGASPAPSESAEAAVSRFTDGLEEESEAKPSPQYPEPWPPAAAEPSPDHASLFQSAEPRAEPEPMNSTLSGDVHAEPRADLFEPGEPSAEASPEPEPERPQLPEPATSLEPAASVEPAASPESATSPEPVATPEFASSDEEHWQVVYAEFVRAREQCGEARAGVPYDRFREKLLKNRDQLVAKYACRTVRFQVYVKEGKAALKASPVR